MNKYLISALLFLGMAGSAVACNTDYNITLQTFGEGILVELKSALMGTIDGDTREEWRSFYASAILHASPEERSLLENVGNAVEPKAQKP